MMKKCWHSIRANFKPQYALTTIKLNKVLMFMVAFTGVKNCISKKQMLIIDNNKNYILKFNIIYHICAILKNINNLLKNFNIWIGKNLHRFIQ